MKAFNQGNSENKMNKKGRWKIFRKVSMNDVLLVVVIVIVVGSAAIKSAYEGYQQAHLVDPNGLPNQNTQQAVVATPRPTECSRLTPYNSRPEFQRGLSLLNQRWSENDPENPIYVNFRDKSLYNCIDIKYIPSGDTSEAEGYFQPSGTVQDLTIYVAPRYYSSDDTLTAILLSHEVTHATDYAMSISQNKPFVATTEECYTDEGTAFATELRFLDSLSGEEQSSILARNTPGSNNLAYLVYNVLRLRGDNDIEKATSYVRSQSFYKQECKR